MSVVDLKKLKKSLLCDVGEKKYGRYQFLHDLKSEILYLVDEQNTSFASIARSLTNNGHSVSSITVGRYYKIFKNENNNNLLSPFSHGKSKKKKPSNNTTASNIIHSGIEQESEQSSNNIQTESMSIAEQNSFSKPEHNSAHNEQIHTFNTTNLHQGGQQTSTNIPNSHDAITGTTIPNFGNIAKLGKGTGHFLVPDDEAI